ncbi:MAG: helix-turn-helix domain-containing protein [Rhodobacteraceae bacterium]|nr:helix-turn-helix domain-containing protein [Paracoccaceae bacterium]
MTDEVSVCLQTENGAAMPGYAHLTAEERDRIADLKAEGLSLRAMARALGRAVCNDNRDVRSTTISMAGFQAS